MSVPYQVVEAPIGPGLDEKTHPAKVDLGKLIGGENFVFNKNGALSKRFGSNQLSSDLFVTGSLNNIQTLSRRQDEIIALTDRKINSYSSMFSKWHNQDNVCECFGFDQKIMQSVFQATEPNVAYTHLNGTDNNGIFVYVWAKDQLSILPGRIKHDIYALIVDASTDSIILGPTQITATGVPGTIPRIVITGNYAIVTYKIDATIRARNIDLTNPIAWSAEVILVNDSVIGLPLFQEAYDAQSITNNTTEFALSYEQNVAAPRFRINKYNASTLALTVTGLFNTTDTAFNALAIHGTQNESIWVIYSSTNPVLRTRVTAVNTATLAPSVPLTTLEAATQSSFVGGCRVTSDRSAFTYSPGSFLAMPQFEAKAAVVNTLGVITATRNLPNALCASRPFFRIDKVYQFVYNAPSVAGSTPIASVLLCDTLLDSSGSGFLYRPICCLNPRQTDLTISFLYRYSCAAQNVTHDIIDQYHTMSVLGISNPSQTVSYQSRSTISFDTSKRTYAELGGLTYFSGGIPSFFDSVIFGEVSFLQIPALTGTGAVTVGASLTLTGGYSYRATYFYIDAQGNIHRGAPSVPFNITLVGAQNSVNLTISTDNATTRQEPDNTASIIGIELWRTLAGGTVYRRIHTFTLPPELANRPDLFSIGYLDVDADSSISTNPILYTTGGVLDGVNPPSAQCVSVHKNRIFYACNKTIWYSTVYVEGDAVRFNEAFTILIDEGGPITGLASMDDKLVIFKEKQIFILYGDGPTILGTQSDFIDPQKVSSNVGCIDPRSVVFTPIGLFFQSKRGIYLLSRQIDVTYIGQSVEDIIFQYPLIVSAQLHPKFTEVRFICSDGLSSVELRYDYRIQQWSTSSYRDAVVGLRLDIKSAMVNENDYYWCTSNIVRNEDTSTYLDAGGYVSMLLEFAPLSVQGTQGYQSVSQVLLNCERKSPHDMTVQLNMDNGTFVQTKQWSNTELAALPKEQLEVHVGKVKNQSLTVRILDTEPAVIVPSLETGEGYSMIGLTYRVGPNDGPQKLIQGARK